MATATKDLLPISPYVFVLQVIQLVLTIVLLGPAAYSLPVLVYDGLSLTIFPVPTSTSNVHTILTEL